jgi:hypothetical protein
MNKKHNNLKITSTHQFKNNIIERLGLAVGGACLLPPLLGSSPHVHACHPAVSYMPTGFAGCSVSREISHGARKLTRTPT